MCPGRSDRRRSVETMTAHDMWVMVVAGSLHMVGASVVGASVGQGVVMPVFVQKSQRCVLFSVGKTGVGPVGVHQDDLVVVEPGGSGQQGEFVGTVWSGLESHFPQKGMCNTLVVANAPVRQGPMVVWHGRCRPDEDPRW